MSDFVLEWRNQNIKMLLNLNQILFSTEPNLVFTVNSGYKTADC